MSKLDPHTHVLLEVTHVTRTFTAGEQTLTVLKGVSLQIHRGEMVAIVGASGSGKSTLMNILGCLDVPTTGQYFINGQDTSTLGPDALAQLRREHFGFIFQRYHLLGDLDAIDNVAVPAVYAGHPVETRHQRAKQLLTQLGLEDRLDHKPSQLSGGQQQRVSVARALMNGGDVILADEPTGALDSQSGEAMMSLLQHLHQQGHTIVIVTHDLHVAEFADRIIEIKDGDIVQDTRHRDRPPSPLEPQHQIQSSTPRRGLQRWFQWDKYTEAFKMALLAMSNHRLRTFLTMLGIIIGIASVVSVVALGAGSQQAILKNFRSLGTNTINIRPGRGFGDQYAGRVRTLVASDVRAIQHLPFVDSATPSIDTSMTIRYGNQSVLASASGVGPEFFRVKGYELDMGQLINQQSVQDLAQEVVIDSNTKQTLFPTENPLGKVIFIDTLPVRIIGVTKPRQSAFGNSDSLKVWIPYTTISGRMLGQTYLDSITVRINTSVPSQAAEQAIIKLLTMRHDGQDFFTINTDTIRQNIERTTATMTLLISAIAIISLIVGGIGVMNIMLVSVTERTKEIGIRMAVGARQQDILRQFLIEAVLVCLCGGGLGIALAYGIGVAFSYFTTDFNMIYSTTSIIFAFVCATLIGVLFGFLPARNAARLNPVDALSRD